jgi:hypothetical protein
LPVQRRSIPQEVPLFSRTDDSNQRDDGFCQNGDGGVVIRQVENGIRRSLTRMDVGRDEGVTDEVAALIETIYETYAPVGAVDD